jgi:hypothetical protein
MAWIMGLIKYHNGKMADGAHYIGWVDAATGAKVPEHRVKAEYEDRVVRHAGVRLINPDQLEGCACCPARSLLLPYHAHSARPRPAPSQCVLCVCVCVWGGGGAAEVVVGGGRLNTRTHSFVTNPTLTLRASPACVIVRYTPEAKLFLQQVAIAHDLDWIEVANEVEALEFRAQVRGRGLCPLLLTAVHLFCNHTQTHTRARIHT